MLICDALAFKVISIYGYGFAASGLIFPLGFLLASIITEVYGFTLAGRIIWVQMLCQASFILTINLFVLLPSPGNSMSTSNYFQFIIISEVLLASTTAVVSAYFINNIIMSKLNSIYQENILL